MSDIDWTHVAGWDDISDGQLAEEVSSRLEAIEGREAAARLKEAEGRAAERERTAGQIEELRSGLRHERAKSGCLYFALLLAAFAPLALSWWRGAP